MKIFSMSIVAEQPSGFNFSDGSEIIATLKCIHRFTTYTVYKRYDSGKCIF